MGQITVTRCDHCDKRTDNLMKEKGWLHFTAPQSQTVNVTRSIGRADTCVCDCLIKISDFCSVECLVAAFDKKAKEREEKEQPRKVEPCSHCGKC